MIVYPPSRHPDTQQHATLSSGRVAGNHRQSNSFALPFDPWPADDRDIDIGEESSPTTMVQRNPKDINRQLEVEVLNENDGVEDILHPIESDLSSSAPPSRLVQVYQHSFIHVSVTCVNGDYFFLSGGILFVWIFLISVSRNCNQFFQS